MSETTHPIDPTKPRTGFLVISKKTDGTTTVRYATTRGAADAWADDEMSKSNNLQTLVKPV